MLYKQKRRLIKINQIGAFCYLPDQMKNSCNLQSQTKLLEKVFPTISTFLRNKTISRTTHCGEKTPSPNLMLLPTNAQGSGFLFNTHGTTTLLSGEEGEERTGTATMFRKMLSKYSIFSTVLSKIVGLEWEGGGQGGDDQLKKKLAASEMIKASAKGQEEVVS